jgi:tetratricopeptide (TPR) repeat protein
MVQTGDNATTSIEDDLRQGRARYEQHDYPRAIVHYTKAIRKNPKNPDAYLFRAQARRYDGDLEGALRDFSAAIRLAPCRAESYYHRAVIRKRNLDLVGAIADYQRYLELCDGQCERDHLEVAQSIRDLKKQANIKE